MQAVILAGGKGTRLRERLGGLPKPMVDICGVPLLERQIILTKQHGFTSVLVLVNHKAEQIAEFCASKHNWGLDIACIDDGQPRGTAGATLAAFDRLDDEFLVLYGDTMLDVDLGRFRAWHAGVPATAASLFLHPNDHPQDSDLVETDDEGRILGFHPYPHDQARYYPNLVNAALYWVERKALQSWREVQGMLDFAKDLFPEMQRSGKLLRGYVSPEYIKDVGTPARLDKVCADFRSGKIARSSLRHPQPAVFLDRDGTINREVDHLRSPAQFELLPGVGAAIRRLNAAGYRCCVTTNQPVIARGECSIEGLREIHNKMETLLGREGAFLDRIYYCPHHPESGFAGERAELKVACDCRKPGTGMIDQAAGDFNVARERSWLVGDSSVDVETARRSGLKSIVVETGYAGLDYRAWATPDAIVPDLGAAVAYILDHYPELLSRCARLAEGIGEGAMVLIGGQSRSGKSTFAHALRDAIRAQGREAQVLSADRWLKSAQARAPGVLGRFDMPALQALVDCLADRNLRPAALSLPGYHKLRRERIDAVDTVPISGTDVVLIEGVVALALRTADAADTVNTYRFHVEIDEDARRQRVLREYRLRGFTEAAALKVYSERRNDEYPLIEAMAASARRIALPAPAP